MNKNNEPNEPNEPNENKNNKNNKREKVVENIKEKIILPSNSNKNDSGSFDKVLQEKMIRNNSYSFSRFMDG